MRAEGEGAHREELRQGMPSELGQAFDLPLDAHMHTELSPDSAVPLLVYAAEAAERGIEEIAITDHLDFNPQAPAFGSADFATRERIVRDVAAAWADRVAIRFGVEITYERAYEDEIRAHLARHRYDYVIGSVHAMRYSPYTAARAASFVAGKTIAEVVEPYFDEVESAIRSGLFDTIGHLDYVKKYLVPWFPPEAFAAAPELYERLLRPLAGSGIALEVNTSGLRQPPRETYPAPWAVARYRELGGRLITVGSDAHAPTQFAFALERACRVLAEAGFEQLAFRRGGKRVAIDLPDRFRRRSGDGAIAPGPGVDGPGATNAEPAA